MAFHSIDKVKVEAELLRRGWKRGPYGELITPSVYSYEQSERDWTESILAGIVCEHEVRIQENKDFIDKHPTQQRNM